MHIVVKHTKTTEEYKKVKAEMEELAIAAYTKHKQHYENWKAGEPVKAWYDENNVFCVQYAAGEWYHYKNILNGNYFEFY